MSTHLRLVFTVLIFTFSISLFGQNQIWKRSSEQRVSPAEVLDRADSPRDFKTFKLNRQALEDALENAPLRSETEVSDLQLKFPTANGELKSFRVVESPVMAPGLAASYPMIKTYKAVAVDDPSATMRFSLTQFGFHSMTLAKSGQQIVDPYSKDREYYTVYKKSTVVNDNAFICELENKTVETESVDPATMDANINSGKLRKFDLALGCTSDYGDIFADADPDLSAKANIQAQMVITINRVNEIYERDLAITLELIENNDDLIFFGSGDNPFYGEDLNAATQAAMNDLLESSDYDIGHSFNTSGGGNAGCIGCVCEDGSKGSGYTGSDDPVGDSFYIDFVAHEMGHQLGAYHTMNTCSRSGDGQTEVEPASGSSIMGYAGICPVNVQNHSDAHFNFVSVRNIANNVNGADVDCSDNTDLTNQAPEADAGDDYTIPKSTAFVLKGEGSDPDGEASLTYNWAQNDPESAPNNGQPQPTAEQGPLYRSVLPKETPNRYFPKKSTVLDNELSSTWEVTPSVGREMNFSFIVRDNGSDFAAGIGQTDADLMKVTVDEDSGPFEVLSQNEETTWYSGANKEVVWDVAGTDNAPVNAENVTIKLSTDGGQNFDVTLAENTPNDGDEIIAVPEGITTEDARIVVEASDNVFYAVNSTAFAIVESDFYLGFDQFAYESCQAEDVVIDFTVEINAADFSNTIDLSTEGLPEGISANFDESTVTESGTEINLTLSDLTAVDPGEYSFEVVGSASGQDVESELTLVLYNATVAPIDLTAPSDQAEGVELQPEFAWNADLNVENYSIEIAEDADFNTLVETAQLSENTYTTTTVLDENTTYYWRVKGENPCGESGFSEASFTTGSCTLCPSSGNTDYETSTTQVIFNGIDNSSGKPSGYSDYTDISTEVSRGETYNISVNLNTGGFLYAAGARVWIDWNQNCNFEENERYELGTTVGESDGATTESPLTIEVPQDAVLGETTMRVSSKYVATQQDFPESCEQDFDGEVEDYTVEVTGGLNVDGPPKEETASLKVFPNPSQGLFTVSLKNGKITSDQFSVQLFDLQGRRVFDRDYQATDNFEVKVNVNKLESGLYLLKFDDGKSTSTQKVVIE